MSTPTRQPKAFEVLPLTDIEKMPRPKAPYIILAKQGPFIYKRMSYGEVAIPITQIPTLPELPEGSYARLDFPNLPTDMLGQVWSFFRWAWDKHKSEAMVDLTFHADHGYRIFVPPQTASAGGVKCLRNGEHFAEDWKHIGTIHSHCNGGAYHSGTDTHDGEQHEAMHITMGHVSANKPDLAVMFTAGKMAWHLKDPHEIYDGTLKLIAHPEWWQRYFDDPATVEHFKNTKFAAGAKPSAPQSRSTWPLGGVGSHNHNDRLWDDEDTNYMGYRFDPKPTNTPNSKTAWASWDIEDMPDLAVKAWETAAITRELASTASNYVTDIVMISAQLSDAIELAAEYGIKVEAKAHFDNTYAAAAAKTYKGPKANDAHKEEETDPDLPTELVIAAKPYPKPPKPKGPRKPRAGGLK